MLNTDQVATLSRPASVSRVGVPMRMYIGTRTVLAMTCRRCGLLRQGHEFGRRRCNNGSFVDRRCLTTCRWRHMEENQLGRNGAPA